MAEKVRKPKEADWKQVITNLDRGFMLPSEFNYCVGYGALPDDNNALYLHAPGNAPQRTLYEGETNEFILKT